MQRTGLYAVTAVVLITALLGGLGVMVWSKHSANSCQSGQVAGGPGAIGGPFTLIDGDGKTVTDTQIITKPTLVYFGYTFCPDVCPVDNARNAEAVDILAKRGIDAQAVFISVDPKRDTPQVMKQYAANMSPRMVGLTGTEEEVRKAAKAYKVYYKLGDQTQDYYLVDHSTFTYLMLPGKGFAGFFRRDVTAQQMADQTACFVKAS